MFIFIACVVIVLMVIMLNSFFSAANDSLSKRKSSQKSSKLIRKDSEFSKPIPLEHNPYSFYKKDVICFVCCRKHPTNGPSFQETRYSAAYRQT